MKTNGAICVMALLAALAGCAVPPQNRPAHVDAEPESVMSLKLNAAPGQFSEMQVAMGKPGNGTDETNIRVKFEKRQASDKWGSVISLCLQGGDPIKDRHCLKLFAIDEKNVIPSYTERIDSNTPKFRQKEFLQRFSAEGELKVKFIVTDNSETFIVNGQNIYTGTLDMVPVRMIFSCSSAICAFNVEP